MEKPVLILVEDCPAGFRLEARDRVVALTARACLGLERLGQPYRLVTDLGSEEKLREGQDRFWREELAWFGLLDGFLKERLPELEERGIFPSALYGYHLKMLIDSLFIRGTELEGLLKEPCGKVRHWTRGGSLTSRLLPLLCSSRGIPYEAVTPRAQPPRENPPGALSGALRGTLQALQLKQWSRLGTGEGRLTLLFMETDFHMSDLLEEALRSGHRCLIRQGNEIRELARKGSKPSVILSAAGERDEQRAGRFRKAAEEILFPTSSLWTWPARWFGVSTAPLLREPLGRWIREDLKECLSLSDSFSRLFSDERVDFVLFSSLTLPLQAGAAAACRRPGGPESVLIAHGEGMDVAEAWDLHELAPYRHYFASSEELAAYFRGRAALSGRPGASVHVGSCRWPRYAELARKPRLYLERWDGRFGIRRNRPPLDLPPARPIVLFPSIWPKKDERYLHRPDYSESWYFQFQKKILEVFAEFPQINFVLKLFPREDLGFSPIGEHLKMMGAENLFLSRAPLSAWYPWTDRLILDGPSTPLYEAALAGVPFHLLLPRGYPLRPSALEQVRPWVTFFGRIEEAAEGVRAILKNPPAGKMSLQPEGESIIRSLEKISLEAADSLQPVLA